jgi:predicted glycosyltransferase
LHGLRSARRSGQCRTVLGIRDILDAPQVVLREWQRDQTERVIEQDFDAIWIYGDPAVYDTVREYQFPPAIAKKARYTGYLRSPRGEDVSSMAHALPVGRMILCVVGGGEDGAPLALAFAQTRLPENCVGAIVTGPFMPPEAQRQIQRLAENNDRLQIFEFVRDLRPLLNRAERVITMGGYNTVCEALAANKPTLIVPRILPRQEQSIRARRLAEMGLVSMLHPAELSPQLLEQWIARDDLAAPPAFDSIDFTGLQRIPGLLAELLGSAPRTAMTSSRQNRRPTHAAS